MCRAGGLKVVSLLVLQMGARPMLNVFSADCEKSKEGSLIYRLDYSLIKSRPEYKVYNPIGKRRGRQNPDFSPLFVYVLPYITVCVPGVSCLGRVF